MAMTWKVDCVGDSSASGVALVVSFLFGHVDGEEQAARNLGAGCVLAMAAHISRPRGLVWWQCEVCGTMLWHGGDFD
jgi:hypothetical protein